MGISPAPSIVLPTDFTTFPCQTFPQGKHPEELTLLRGYPGASLGARNPAEVFLWGDGAAQSGMGMGLKADPGFQVTPRRPDRVSAGGGGGEEQPKERVDPEGWEGQGGTSTVTQPLAVCLTHGWVTPPARKVAKRATGPGK